MTPGVVWRESAKTTPGVISCRVVASSRFWPRRGASVSAPQRSDAGAAGTGAGPTGVREAAWSPDSKRLAVTLVRRDLDDDAGRQGREARRRRRRRTGPSSAIPRGRLTASRSRSAPSTNGRVRRVDRAGRRAARRGASTSMPGDERWPSWTRDGRTRLFASRSRRARGSCSSSRADGPARRPTKLTPDDAAEWQGTRLARRQARRVRVRPRAGSGQRRGHLGARAVRAGRGELEPASARVTRAAGTESSSGLGARQRARRVRGDARRSERACGCPRCRRSTAPAGRRRRTRPRTRRRPQDGARRRRGRDRGRHAGPGLASSRRARLVARRPDARSSRRSRRPIAGYNGNPNRNDDDPPMAFAGAEQFALWRVLAPRAVDEARDVADAARAGRGALDVRRSIRSGRR